MKGLGKHRSEGRGPGGGGGGSSNVRLRAWGYKRLMVSGFIRVWPEIKGRVFGIKPVNLESKKPHTEISKALRPKAQTRKP